MVANPSCTLDSPDTYSHLPRVSELKDLGCGQSLGHFRSSPGDSTVQINLGTTALEQRWSNYGPQAKSGPSSASVNKVLLGHMAPTHLCAVTHTHTQLSSHQLRPCGRQSYKDLLSNALQRKFADSCSKRKE